MSDAENQLRKALHSSAPPVGLFGLQPPKSGIAPVYLIPLLAAAERAGFAGDALFHGLGLAAHDLAVPGLGLTPNEAVTVVRRALRLLDAPDLGLTLGMNTRITERGVMALGLLAADTLGVAMALPTQFPASAGYLMAVNVEHSKSIHVVIAESMLGNSDIEPFLVDIMFAGAVRMYRQATGTHYVPSTVELVRPRPANVAAYESFFGCPVHFGCSRNGLATDVAWLDYPLPMASAMAYRLSLQLLRCEFERADIASPLRSAVERAILRALPLAAAPAEIAHSLNLGERSMRRKLAQEGLSFRGLLDEARKTRALELMSSASWSINAIAVHTGFSDVRAFSRAFRRWTGTSPSSRHAVMPIPKVGPGSSGGP